MGINLEALLAELRDEVRKLQSKTEAAPLPRMLTYERAARELSVSQSKLKGLVRSSAIATCEIGKRKYIPAIEIERIERSARTVAQEAPAQSPRAKRGPRRAGGPSEAEKMRSALRKAKP